MWLCPVGGAKAAWTRSDQENLACPSGLRGRGGSTYLQAGGNCINVIQLYVPPRPSNSRDLPLWKATCVKLIKWMDQMVVETPLRYTPVVCTDLNLGLGMRNQILDTDGSVGPWGATEETETGRLFHDWLMKRDITAANTMADLGPTFIGANGGADATRLHCCPAFMLEKPNLLDTGLCRQGKGDTRQPLRPGPLPYCDGRVPVVRRDGGRNTEARAVGL